VVHEKKWAVHGSPKTNGISSLFPHFLPKVSFESKSAFVDTKLLPLEEVVIGEYYVSRRRALEREFFRSINNSSKENL